MVWVESHYAKLMDLQVDDKYTLGGTDLSIANRIPVQIAGLWEARNRQDQFWYKDAIGDYSKSFLITRADFETIIYARTSQQASFISWYFLLDESRLNLDRGDSYLSGLKSFINDAQKYMQGGRVDVSPVDELALAQQRKQSLTLILTG